MPYYFKKISVILLILSGTLFTSCLKDKRAYCPEDEFNLEVRFHMYAQDGTTDVFRRNINSVHLVLFDESNRYYAAAEADAAALAGFQGIRMKVEPASYYVMAWANVTEPPKTYLNDNSTLDEACLEFATTRREDAIHYAPKLNDIPVRSLTRDASGPGGNYQVMVLPREVCQHDLEFMTAYREVKVWIKGLSALPGVEVTNLPAGYNFSLTSHSGLADYMLDSQSEVTSLGELALAHFNTPFFEIRDDIWVNIYEKQTGDLLYDFGMKTFLEQIGELPGPTDPIDLLVEFMENGDISVSLIDWKKIPVDPIR